MRTIKLTDEQAQLLEKLLEHEMDEEFLYQVDGDKETDYYAKLLDLYKAIQAKPRNGIEAFVIGDIIECRRKEMEEIKA